MTWSRTHIVLLLVLSVTLGLFWVETPGQPTVHATPPAQGMDATLRIINESDQTICYVFVCPPGARNSTDCSAEEKSIVPEGEHSLEVSVGIYDVHLFDCEVNKLLSKRSLNISGTYELRFSGPDPCETLNQKGMASYQQAKYRDALQQFQDALACYQKVGDREREGKTLNGIGLVYDSLGQYEEALDYHLQALAIVREIDDRTGEGVTLNNIGSIYYHLGQYQEARNYLEQALMITREIGDRAEEGAMLNNIGGIYRSLGQYREALDYLEQALAIRVEISDHAGEEVTLNNIGVIYHHLGQYQEALDYYQQTLAITREIGDRAVEETTLNNIGGIYSSLGQYEEALDYYQQALAIQVEIGDRAGKGTTLNNIGGIYDHLGQYQQALDYYQQALAIRVEIGDRAGEGTSLNDIGVTYYRLGQYEEALDYYEQSLAIRREIGDRAGEGTTLSNIGLIYDSLGQYEEALDYYGQALAIQVEIGDRAGEGTTLNNIGSIYYHLGQYEEALDYYGQALAIQVEIGDRAGEGAALNNIGSIYDSLGQYKEALDYYGQALMITRETGDRAWKGRTLNNIGRIYDSIGQYEEALGYYQQAVSTAEIIRGEMTVEELKSSFAAERLSVSVYNGVISVLIKMERPQDAFGYVQRAKARTLLDQMGNAQINPLTADDPALVQQEEQLRGEIQALDKQLREEWAMSQEQRSDEAIQSLITQLETKRTEYAELLTRLKLNNPEYASLVTVNTLTLIGTHEILTDTMLVEYYVTADQTFAFVVTQDEFHSVSISVTQKSLNQTIQSLYAFPSLDGVPKPMQELYQILIAPLEPFIHTDLVVIAPHSVLHYVPFGALHDGEHYLVEKHTLFTIPSASVLPFAFEKRKSEVAALLILGDPDGSLPNGRQEAQAVAELYGVSAHVGDDALEKWLWEQGDEAGILHLSTHGVYNAHSPLFSYVLLAEGDDEDGLLQVYEIYNRGLNLANVDLVVLSACQTNLGELSRGDEIVGLSRALIYAGAPSVVSGLWSVSDESTRVLMERFYTHLQAGMSKAGALRQAQMEMIADAKYAHPYYWAAFTLTGDDGGSEVVDTARHLVEPKPVPINQSVKTPSAWIALVILILIIILCGGCIYICLKKQIISSRVMGYRDGDPSRPRLTDVVKEYTYRKSIRRLALLIGIISLLLAGIGLWWYYFR